MTSYVLFHSKKSHDCSSNQVLPARPTIMMVIVLNYSVTAYALKRRQPKTRNTTKLRIMIPALPEMAREHKTSGEMSCGSAKDTCPNAKGAPIRCPLGPLVYAKQRGNTNTTTTTTVAGAGTRASTRQHHRCPPRSNCDKEVIPKNDVQ